MPRQPERGTPALPPVRPEAPSSVGSETRRIRVRGQPVPADTRPVRAVRARRGAVGTRVTRFLPSGRDLLSIEACFALFLFSGRFKTLPEFNSIPVDLTAVFLVATIVLLGWAIGHHRIRPLPVRLPIVLMILFSELALISVSWSSLDSLNFDKLARFLLLTSPSYFMACMIAQDPVRRARLVRMLAWVSCAIVGYYAFYRYALGVDMQSRTEPTGDNYLEYGEQASTLFITVLALGVLGTRKQIPIAILGMGATLFLLLTLGSRGPLLFALMAVPLLGLGVLVRLRSLASRFTRLAVLIGGVLALGALGYLAAEQSGVAPGEISSGFRTLERIQLQLSRESTTSLDERAQGQEFALEQWLKKPMLGWGIGEFRVENDYLKYPHNLLLEILMEMGIIGGALFASGCAISLWACARIARDRTAGWVEAAVALLFVTDLVSHLTVQGYLADDRIFFALTGMAVVACREPSRRRAALPGLFGRTRLPSILTRPRFAPARAPILSEPKAR